MNHAPQGISQGLFSYKLNLIDQPDALDDAASKIAAWANLLPEGWKNESAVTVSPLLAAGRGAAVTLPVQKERVRLRLQPGTPYVVESGMLGNCPQ